MNSLIKMQIFVDPFDIISFFSYSFSFEFNILYIEFPSDDDKPQIRFFKAFF